MRRCLDLLAIFSLAVSISSPPALAVELPLNSVVRISAKTERLQKQGSGFVVKVSREGAYVVTTAHVVEGDKSPRVALGSNPQAWIAASTLRLEGGLEDGLAVLLMPKSTLPGNVTKLVLHTKVPAPDEDVTVVGFPRVIGALSVVTARTSQRGRNLVLAQQVDEGFSGSPMLWNGRVIGIVTRSERYGIGVTVNAVRDFLRGSGISLAATLEVSFLRKWGSEGQGRGQFLRPWGIATRFSDGQVYVGDGSRGTVQVFRPTARSVGQLPGTIMGSFLAVDSNGQVYALNYDPATGRNERIDIYAYGDHRHLGGFPLRGSAARAIDVDIYGRNIYVADINDHRVRRYDSSGRVTAKWGSHGPGNGQFNGPWGIAVDRYRTRRIYVADTGNNRIQAFTRDGEFLTAWGSKGTGDGQFDSPIDVAVDTSRGYVYVLDRKNARVQVFTPDGEFLEKWGSPGTGNGKFLDPYGISIDGEDNIYVIDSGNYRVQVFRATWR